MGRILNNFLRNTAFRQQLSITVTAGVICIALFSSLASSWQGSRQIRSTLLEQGERVAETLANNSTLALLYTSSENASEAVNTTLSFPDVTRVEIRTPSGAPLVVRGAADSELPEMTPPPESTRLPYLQAETRNSWRFVAPVLIKREGESPFEVVEQSTAPIGYVSIVQSKATLTRMMARIFLVNLTISFFFAFVFLVAIRFLAGRLTRPITALSKAMAQAERGESDVHAKPAGPKDIADMAHAFNRMITVLQEREQALRESRARYREVVDSVNEVIFQTDAQGRLTFLNRAWGKITGLPLEQSLGQPLTHFIQLDSRPLFDLWQTRLMERPDTDCRYEVRFQRADGSIGWVEIIQRSQHDMQRRFIGTSGTLDDITERKAAEQQLKTLNLELENRVRARTAELEASNRDLEAFSYSVSHDLRAPLRGIGGFAYILEEDYGHALDEKGRSHLMRIRSATHRMAELIDDLLELARISRVTINHHPVNLTALAQGIVNELRDAEPQRQVNVVIGENLTANADPTLMRVVLDNLLRNAWKFTGKRAQGSIVFDAEMRNDRKVFFVRDNGAGFDMAHAGQLFQPFNRLHSLETFSGSGIGLATVHRIIQRHNGQVWAEAAVEKGATFYFMLPE